MKFLLIFGFRCLSGSKGIDASSVNDINNSSSGGLAQPMLQSRCFLKVGNETIKCIEWTFFYPHGITKTWINEVLNIVSSLFISVFVS